MKAKSQLFLNLEAQNKYIEEITNDDKMIIEAPDPKRKKEKDEIHKINKFDGGLLMAEEFNKANYMYPVKQAEIQETDELKPQSIINKTKMHHFQRLKSIRMGLSPELRENNSNIQNLQIFHNIKYR